jgi:hypothetical protein
MTMLRVRQTATSSAPMPNARPWRRRQRPAAAQRCAEGAGLDGVDRGRSTISCAVPRTGESLTTSLTGADAPMRASPTSRIYTCLTDVTEVGQQGGGEGRQIGHGAGIYRMALKRCSKTTDVMVLAAMAGIAWLSGTRTLPGLSPRLRSRTLYRSIRRRTIYTGCLTTASRWGRLLWPLLAGRMRLYRMGLSLLCGCSRWLLTSRNTVSEARWMATSGS